MTLQFRRSKPDGRNVLRRPVETAPGSGHSMRYEYKPDQTGNNQGHSNEDY